MAIRIPGERRGTVLSWKQGIFLLLLFDFFRNRLSTTSPLIAFLDANAVAMEYQHAPTTSAPVVDIAPRSNNSDEDVTSRRIFDPLDDTDEKLWPMTVTRQQTPASIFYCTKDDQNAFGEARSILSTVLPEYDFVKTTFVNGRERLRWKQQHINQENRNHPWDFFLLPLTETCNGIVFKWLIDDFQGSIIYFSGESISDYMPLRMKGGNKFMLGPATEHNKTDRRVMTLTYLQMTWWGIFRPQLLQKKVDPDALLIEPSKRPQGKKETQFLIYAASNCVRFRDEAYLALSSIGPANHGGPCNGNGRGNRREDAINRTFVRNGISLSNWDANVEFYSGFRFCLVMEHVYEQPYVTEKILMAFLGGCIPIYYGSTMVFDIFHPDAFVYYNVSDPSDALARVAHLERDPNAYQTAMSNPILKDGNATLTNYFDFEGAILKKRIRDTLKLHAYKFV